MKTFGTLVIAVSMLLSAFCAQAHAADEQDMAKITCKEFLDDKQNMPLMIMWIDGYMSGKSDNTTMSGEWVEKLGKHLGEFCGKNPGKTIMSAMEAMPE